MSTPTEKSIVKDRFYSQRRQHRDEVLFNEHLNAVDKIVAIGTVMRFVHRRSAEQGSASTFADMLTIAKALGVKHLVFKKSMAKLIANGHFRKIDRAGKTPLIVPLLRNNIVLTSTRGGKDFQRTRDDLVEEIAFDRELTPGERVVGIGVLAMADPAWECDAGQSELARQLSVSRKAVNEAMPKLRYHGYILRYATGNGNPESVVVVGAKLNKCRTSVEQVSKPRDGLGPVTQPVTSPVTLPVTQPVTLTSQKAREMGTSDANLLNLCNLRNLNNPPLSKKREAPGAARHGRSTSSAVPFLDYGTWCAFEELYGLIEDCSNCKGVKTVAGIIELLEGGDRTGFVTAYGTHASRDNLFEFIGMGLLERNGQHVRVTALGEETYGAGYIEDEQQEAA